MSKTTPKMNETSLNLGLTHEQITEFANTHREIINRLTERFKNADSGPYDSDLIKMSEEVVSGKGWTPSLQVAFHFLFGQFCYKQELQHQSMKMITGMLKSFTDKETVEVENNGTAH